jgi:hypothetical protein
MTEPTKPGEQTFEQWWPQRKFRIEANTLLLRECWNAAIASERAARSFEIEGRDKLITAQSQRIAELEAAGRILLTEVGTLTAERDEARKKLAELRSEVRISLTRLQRLSKIIDSEVIHVVNDQLAAALEGRKPLTKGDTK